MEPQLIHSPPPLQTSTSALAKGMDEILPSLWLGDILSTYNTTNLLASNITTIISLINQPLPFWLRQKYIELGISHHSLHIEDDELQDILVYLPQICKLIEGTLASGHGVLVHCQLGISRSGTAVVAYIMRARKIDRDRALDIVKRARPQVKPNAGFWEQLEVWERCEFDVWDEVQAGHGVKDGVDDVEIRERISPSNDKNGVVEGVEDAKAVKKDEVEWREKEEYQVWKTKAEELMRDRVMSFK